MWKLEDSPALNIRENQYVYIDCGGRYFNYHSKKGELTMGKGSTLHYYNCSLLDYEFPDSNRVYGTVHAITSSVIGMQACQVRANQFIGRFLQQRRVCHGVCLTGCQGTG